LDIASTAGDVRGMPTILLIQGWRLFFYSNERDESMHVHARKEETECKYWINSEVYEIEEAWSFNLTSHLRREIRRIIFDHFDLIVGKWRESFGDKKDATN
jgi:hypothetical protein